MKHFWKRGLPVLACAVALGGGIVAPASAFAQDHGGGAVTVAKNGETVTIGNDYLTRTFSHKDGKWATSSIVNKRVGDGLTLVPQAGSEDFVINLIDGDWTGPVEKNPTQVLDRAGWKGTATNNAGKAFAHPEYLFDGDKNTFIDEYQNAGYPASIVIDLGSKQTVGSFSFDKRPGYQEAAFGKNGTMGKYKLFVSEDGKAWTPAGSGEFTAEDYNLHEADGLYNVGDTVYGNFDKTYTTRYVKIEQHSDCLGGTQEFTGAEINLYSDQKTTQGNPDDTDIRTSELKVAKVDADDAANTVRVEFEPFACQGTTWQVAEVVAMEDGAHYMNSHLEIKADDADATKIDYIDMDSFVLPRDAKDVWSIPDESKVSSMWIGKHELMLGQPIYVDGLFMGSEFPAEETDVLDATNTTKMRYYSGKDFAKMAADGQELAPGEGGSGVIMNDDGSAVFRTWSNVVGAAQGTEENVVQTDFFTYIDDLATPSQFRKQYNSWYDNMMNISPDSVEKSFMGSEKGLAQNGVEPLDSYVVDDGWNNYNSRSQGMTGVGESGSSYNEVGFWSFNDKWPNELYDSTSLAHKLNSSFGMWVGPQGGYNFFSQFGRYLEDSGTGFTQHNSALGDVVCTGSHKYLKNYTERFLDYQKRFDIDYWKWDGFASRPCNSADHDHMVGGPNNMYFTSDMWEEWTDLFETFRAARAEEGKGLWINATCYINPSPWMLQWVNTIWVQDSGDTGEAGNEGAERHQQKIYYRDHVYYNMFKNNGLQFPLKNVYNHDPIYGVSDGSKATPEVFREFLLDNAMRGTAFWELYYSPSLFTDEMWSITADVLDFAETNNAVLNKAKLFFEDGAFQGTNLSSAVEGVYGYSAWLGDSGFVSFVNPTDQQKTYTLDLTDVNGVPQGMANLAETQIYPYAAAASGKKVSYGDKLTVTLEPHSTKIFQYGAPNKKAAPSLVYAKVTGKNTVEVRFSDRMNSDAISFTVNGKKATATLGADYRTFTVTTDDELAKKAELEISGAKNIYGIDAEGVSGKLAVTTAGTLTKAAAKDLKAAGLPVNSDGSHDYATVLGQTVTVADAGVAGNADFAATAVVKDIAANAPILRQGDDWSLSVDADGYVVFTAAGLTATSKEDVTTVTAHERGTFGTGEFNATQTKTETRGKITDGKTHAILAVRELNGFVKLYVDGELAGSAYDKDHAHASMSGAPVTLGGAGATYLVSDVALINSARYYDDAAKQASEYAIGTTSVVESQEGWNAQACSQASDKPGTGGDGPAADAIDGDTSTYWHSNYSGQDHCDGVHTLSIDFGKAVSFDRVIYTARPGASNGTWASVKIYAVNKDGAKTLVADVPEVKLDHNAATFMLNDTVTAQGVSFEIQGKGGFASAAEVQVANAYNEIDTSAVTGLQAYAAQAVAGLNKDDYTAESWAAFMDAKAAIDELNPFDEASSGKVDALRAHFDAARDALEGKTDPTPQPGDKGGLEDKVNGYENEGLDGSQYTSDSWKAYQDALAHAKEVLAKPDATQAEIDAALGALQKAHDALVPAGGVAPKPDDGGKDDGTGSGKGDKDPAGTMPQTGDASFVAAAAAGLSGLAAAGGGIALARKKRK